MTTTVLDARTSLRDDQRGAVMLTGLFMAFFLVGALWFVIGIGDAVIFRDRMQEAADHAVFSSAATHAKGMNFISACNIIMLLMVAVHIVFGIIQDVTILTCLAAGIGCISCALACPKIPGAISNFHNWSRRVKTGLTWMAKVEKVIAIGTPWAGTARGYSVGSEYGNQGRVGSVNVVPMSASNIPGLAGVGLPVQAKPFSFLCEKAGWELANVLLGWIPYAGKFAALVGGNAFGAFFKFRYCNSVGNNNDPTLQATKNRLNDAQEELQTGRRQTEASNASAGEGEQLEIPGLGSAGNPNASIDTTTTGQSGAGWSPYFDPGFDKGWGDPGPLVVDSNAGNGKVAMQVWSIAMNPKYRETNERPISTAANVKDRNWATDSDQGSTAFGYFAQAEFYYDCEQKWSEDDCNGTNSWDASFGIRWRARLRKLELPNLFQILSRFALNPASKFIKNAVGDLIKDSPLGKALGGSTGGAVAIDTLAATLDTLVVTPLLGKIKGGINDFGSSLLPTGLSDSYH